MSKNGSKKSRARALATGAALIQVPQAQPDVDDDLPRCECGWELPVAAGVKFDNGQITADFVLSMACPICGLMHQARYGESKPVTPETDRIRCNVSILDSSRLPLSATSRTSPLLRKAA